MHNKGIILGKSSGFTVKSSLDDIVTHQFNKNGNPLEMQSLILTDNNGDIVTKGGYKIVT